MTEEEALAGLFSQLDDIEEPEVEDLTQADPMKLRLELAELDRKLSSMGELLGDPTTQEARDLHSRRGAIVAVLKTKGKL